MNDPMPPDDEANAESLSRQAREHLDAGRFEEAAAGYERALALDATRVDDWVNRGLALWQQKLNEPALDCYDRALALHPQNALAWMNRGNALHGLNRPPEDVLKCYDRALDLDPQLATAWYNKGDTLGQMGRIIEAKACFENARDLGMNAAAGMVAYCNDILMNDLYA